MGKSRKTMGISRDSFHKRRKTGGKLTPWRKKRKFELGRPPSMTKIGGTRIHTVRVRGGSMKYRALRLDSGNFAWPTESVTKRTRVLNVVYNASNNEPAYQHPREGLHHRDRFHPIPSVVRAALRCLDILSIDNTSVRKSQIQRLIQIKKGNDCCCCCCCCFVGCCFLVLEMIVLILHIFVTYTWYFFFLTFFLTKLFPR